MQIRSMIKLAAVGAALLAASAPALAGVTNTNLSVNATVSASCTVSVSAMSFGTVDTLVATADDATSTMNVTCTPGTAWSATAGAGAGTGATVALRKMTIPATTNTLDYTLHTDSGRTIVWGDGVAPNGSFTGTGNGAVQASTIYGRVPTGQGTAAIGSYTDTVAVTVTF